MCLIFFIFFAGASSGIKFICVYGGVPKGPQVYHRRILLRYGPG